MKRKETTNPRHKIIGRFMQGYNNAVRWNRKGGHDKGNCAEDVAGTQEARGHLEAASEREYRPPQNALDAP